MFTLLKKDAIKLLEVELVRLEELLDDVSIRKNFEWGLTVCSVCTEAARITGTVHIRSRKMCKACTLFGIQDRCREIEIEKKDAVFITDDEMSEDDIDYFKRLFAELIRSVENWLLQVKSDDLESYTIIAEI